MTTLISFSALAGTDLSTVEKAADLAVKWPITVGFFVILIAVLLSIRWVATVGWPRWQQEQEVRRVAEDARRKAIVDEAERTRQHMTDLLKQKDDQAAATLRSVTDVEAAKQKAIVDGIGAKVDAVATATAGVAREVVVVEATARDITGKVESVHVKVEAVHAKVSGIHDLVQRLLAQKGVAVLLLVIGLGAALGGVSSWDRGGERAGEAAPLPGKQCQRDSDCPAPQYCAGGVCCRNANGRRCRPRSEPTGPTFASQPRSGDVFRDDVSMPQVVVGFDRWTAAMEL